MSNLFCDKCEAWIVFQRKTQFVEGHCTLCQLVKERDDAVEEVARILETAGCPDAVTGYDCRQLQQALKDRDKWHSMYRDACRTNEAVVREHQMERAQGQVDQIADDMRLAVSKPLGHASTSTPLYPFTADDGMVFGQVLAECPSCRKIVEVQEGWVTPEHLKLPSEKVCDGSGKPPRRYEKQRFADEARRHYGDNGESEHQCFRPGAPDEGSCQGDGWFRCCECSELEPYNEEED